MVQKYLGSAGVARDGRSALIRMPTGTGKSGIIAGIARNTPGVKNVLVVTPWSLLRDQLAEEIQGVSWASRTAGSPAVSWPPLDAVGVVGTTAAAALSASATGIHHAIVITSNALVDIAQNDPSTYAALRQFIDVVVFDEGHREPAPAWAESIRGLARPTVLLTATPCRNDDLLFHADPAHTFILAYPEARAAALVRDVEFVTADYIGDVDGFVDAFYALLYSDLKGFPHAPSERAIVRCGSFEQVERVASLLENLGVTVLALHERYKRDARPSRQAEVPRRGTGGPEATATVWIAEEKLVEGVDNASFRILGLCSGFRDARSLVQQVGRVTRNPTRDPDAKAIVLAAQGEDQETLWAEYIAFEAQPSAAATGFGAKALARAVLGAVPACVYLERRYRPQFDLNAPDVHAALNYPSHATVSRVPPAFRRADCVKAVVQELEREGAEIVRHVSCPSEKLDLVLYLVAGASRLVRVGLWPEYELNAVVIAESGPYVFCTETRRRVPEAIRSTAGRVTRPELERLLGVGTHRVEFVTLRNTHSGPGSVRQRALQMESLDEIAGDAADHIYTCRNARAVLDVVGNKSRRRYVGFGTARVSEASAAAMSYEQYVAWITEVSDTMAGKGQPPNCLARFAREDARPADVTPVAMELDVVDLAACYASDSGAEVLDVPEGVVDIRNGRGRIKVKIGGSVESYDCALRWDDTARGGHGEYAFTSVGLDQQFSAIAGTPASGLTVSDYLTRSQHLTVFVPDANVVYADATFQNVGRLAGGAAGFWLRNHLEPVPGLDTPMKEKGRAVMVGGRATWKDDSLFGLIDRLGNTGPSSSGSALRRLMSGLDLLVCDDLGTEAADFVGVSTSDRRFVLIHAKARKLRGSSASGARRLSATSLQEVCAQAAKNLSHLTDGGTGLAERAAGWDKPWGRRVPRVRLGAADGTDALRKIQKVLSFANTTREAWVVVGGAFSFTEFEQQRNSAGPKPWVIALETLLQSTATATRAAGGNFRLFCAP